jgi:hypothetical protein
VKALPVNFKTNCMQKKAIKFIRKAISIRQALLRANASQKNSLQMAQYLGVLNKQLDMTKSNLGEARLLLKYEAIIRDILPGLSSKCGYALHSEFTRLVQDAKLFIQSFQYQSNES